MTKFMTTLSLFLFSVIASANDFSANLGVENNKLLRGFSLSNEEASVNGYAGFGNQYFYTGAKAFSNIQINGGEVEELVDWFVGKQFDNKFFTLDLGYVHHYFTETENTDSGEWYVGALLDNHKLHFYQNNDLNETYIDYNASYDLFSDYKLHTHLGMLDSSELNGKDFIDYSLGIGKSFESLNVNLLYSYNDNKDLLREVAGSNIVLSFSRNW